MLKSDRLAVRRSALPLASETASLIGKETGHYRAKTLRLLMF
jgi:hypothetical protein